MFGIITLWFALSAKLVLLMLLARQPGAWMALWMIPAWGRFGPVVWAQTPPPLDGDMGQRFGQAAQGMTGIVWVVVLGALSLQFASALLWTPALLLAWRLFLRIRVGGMSGDCLGAGIEVVEALSLGLVVIVS